jgi:hypothetical protein
MLIEILDAESTPSQVVGEIACTDPTTFRFIEEKSILKIEPMT